MKKTKAKTKQPVRAIPLPEAIDGKRWDIRQSQTPRIAGISVTGVDTMLVPMGDNDLERLVRLHEMTHISITPRDQVQEVLVEKEVDEQILNMCEDSRVHSQMNRLGFGTRPLRNILSDAEIKEMAENAHPAVLAASAAAMYETGEANRLANASETDPDRRAIVSYGFNLAYSWIHGQSELPSFEEVVEMAKEIQLHLGDPNSPDPPPPPPVPPAQLPALAEKPDPTSELPPPDVRPSRKRPKPNAGLGPWLPVVFEEPPRPLKFPPKMLGTRKKRIPAPRGRRLHRIGRLHVDGYVYADRPKKKGGGAILIDTSGSMSLTVEEVLQLCVTYPGGIIASYSSGGVAGHAGTLRVVAKNGKRVENHLLSTPGSGNGIDGPALDWLATQPGPRFWISDAGVEGGAIGLRYCLAVCRKANITRVDDAWEIVGKEFDE